MNPVLAYALGVLTPLILLAAFLGYVHGTDTGKQIECRACGYDTGPMDTTWRSTCWVRWRWHKLTTGHHTRRWLRQQDEP